MGSGDGSGSGRGHGAGGYKGKMERFYIPAMPLPLAITCCILNFLFPGLGTMISGFCQFCCARNEDLDAAPRVMSCCINFLLGLLQLLTTLLCLVGWFWSCIWGGFYLVTSAEYYHNNRPEDVENNGQRVITHQPGVVSVYPENMDTSHLVLHPQFGWISLAPGSSNGGNHATGNTGNQKHNDVTSCTQGGAGGLEPPPSYSEASAGYNQTMSYGNDGFVAESPPSYNESQQRLAENPPNTKL